MGFADVRLASQKLAQRAGAPDAPLAFSGADTVLLQPPNRASQSHPLISYPGENLSYDFRLVRIHLIVAVLAVLLGNVAVAIQWLTYQNVTLFDLAQLPEPETLRNFSSFILGK